MATKEKSRLKIKNKTICIKIKLWYHLDKKKSILKQSTCNHSTRRMPLHEHMRACIWACKKGIQGRMPPSKEIILHHRSINIYKLWQQGKLFNIQFEDQIIDINFKSSLKLESSKWYMSNTDLLQKEFKKEKSATNQTIQIWWSFINLKLQKRSKFLYHIIKKVSQNIN